LPLRGFETEAAPAARPENFVCLRVALIAFRCRTIDRSLFSEKFWLTS
jgi:hypothetical protein